MSDIENLATSTDSLARETATLAQIMDRFLAVTNYRRIVSGVAAITVLGVLFAIAVFTAVVNHCQDEDGWCDLIIPQSTEEVVADIVARVDANANVFGNYPTQQVREVTADSVHVRGTKCINGEEEVTVSGALSWQSVNPPGSIVPIGSGTSTREPGCITQDFVNPIPFEVRQLSNRNGGMAWTIVGHESIGAQIISWSTEPFRVEADN